MMGSIITLMDLVLILGPHNRKSQSKIGNQEKYREKFFQKAFKNQEDNQDINPEDRRQSSKSKFSKFQRQSQDSSSSDEN